MPFGIRALCGLSVIAALPAIAVSAEPHWTKARLGSFEAISDDGRRSATQALSQFEQFSFALGTLMGKPGLELDPPLRIVVFRKARDLQAECPPGLITGRDHLMACTTAEGQLPESLLRPLTRTLLEDNFPRMPASVETALVTFFGTVRSTAVHVTWGDPPAPSERTRDWALLHRILTQPDYAGRAGIYLQNLTTGMDQAAAIRNAFGEDPAKFQAEVDRYDQAGVFDSATAPNRPLNPDRDFYTTFLTADDFKLMRADLLTPASKAIYESFLQAGKYPAEANEGLALLAMRDNDLALATPYMEAARKAGTRNFTALTAYATLQSDPDKAIQILKEALTLNPKYAQAHWVFGEKLSDPARRMAEWKQAVDLSPRKYAWWAEYAQLCVDQKQYVEAGRAWVAAAQAAPNAQLREQYLTARGRIEQQRLDAEDAERRRVEAAKTAGIERLKTQARQELADAEARANPHPLSKEEVAKAVDWFGDAGTQTIAGNLVRVECAGKRLRLSVRDDAGKTSILLIPDAQQFELRGADTLACGVQKSRRVSISYKPAKPDSGKAVLGEATVVEVER